MLTGQVDERTIQKYEREAKEKNRESWYLAYIMDTNEEERAKGKTVEVGRAHFTTEKKRYTLLDAPGHKNYVPNMIGGASQADIGVLVISARKGEFEAGFDRGGQTREHAMLAKTLGLQKLVVLVNKMDEKDVAWKAERFDQIEGTLAPFLKKCGFASKGTFYLSNHLSRQQSLSPAINHYSGGCYSYPSRVSTRKVQFCNPRFLTTSQQSIKHQSNNHFQRYSYHFETSLKFPDISS